MAIRLVVLLFESALVELLETERTDEMFGVKFARHCSNAAAADWFVAACTQGTTFGVIMELTIRLAFVFEEASAVEGLPAILKKNFTLVTSHQAHTTNSTCKIIFISIHS
ncbi:hypothetical protein NPIL_268671 [Nephila pilipes]|uniref:Secreted protein n=1 Tax=Nephila pilipes TaxID=299642 RepID=A0A8X6NJX1_NEPPI|nr:hypothetical protein NPIL_268671 [Nephila pilipes]